MKKEKGKGVKMDATCHCSEVRSVTLSETPVLPAFSQRWSGLI